MVVGFEGGDVEAVALLHLVDEVFQAQVHAGELHFQAAAGLAEAGNLLAQLHKLVFQQAHAFKGCCALLGAALQVFFDRGDGPAL